MSPRPPEIDLTCATIARITMWLPLLTAADRYVPGVGEVDPELEAFVREGGWRCLADCECEVALGRSDYGG